MTPVTELDIAPLTWVRSEIDAALGRALEAIGQAEQGEAGNDQLRFAQNHVHQVQGALSMVGLDGVTQFAEALDGLLIELASGKRAFAEAHASLLRRALIALGNYLAELEDGAAHQPLRLYPLLVEIAEARGIEAPSQGELFFPDLARRVPQLAAPIAVDANRAAKELRLLRGRFEKGLLTWLRQPASDAGPREMLFAVSRIAQLNAAPSTRSFWWATIAFFEGLVQGAIASDRDAQRLCRRIDTQMKRLLDGSQVVAERLVRDVLFHVASAHIESGHAKAVREAYQLDRLIPAAEAQRVAETPLAPVQRSLREALENAKEAWNRFAAGAAVALPQMQEQLTAARGPLETLQLPQLESLVRALDSTAGWLRKDPLKSNEDLSMDVATALLLAERAVDAPAGSDAQLREQVAAVCHRLLQRVSGRDPGPLDETLFGEASRHVQEKLFFNQLAREIQTTLGQVEQTLDSFFRDPSARDSLAALAAPLKQVEGAFAMLGEQRAVVLVRENGERIAGLTKAEVPEAAEFERVAHELSALGFFVEALRHGPANLERFLAPHGGAVAQEEVPVTVEAEVRQQSRELQQRVQALSDAPADEKLRAELKQNLETLREDAALLADTKLEQQARDALAALKSGGDSEAVKEAVASISPAPAVTAPSADAARLIEASEEQIDAELLEIFLEEADEVLETIRTHREATEREPHNQENVVTIRRGFHTLKGSSRMVGLIDFSDAGKAVEFAMNRWLQLERDAAPEMLSLVSNAHVVFTEWVAQLKSGGALWKDASALIAQAEALLNANDPLAAAPAVAPVPAPGPAPAATTYELSDEQGPVDLDLEAATEFDLNATMINPDAEGAGSPAEPETIDLTSTLLAPFNLGDEDAAEASDDLLEPFEEIAAVEPAQSPAVAEEAIDLTASLVGIVDDSDDATQRQLVVTALEPVADEVPEQVIEVPAEAPQTLDFSLEELSLTDEEALPGGRPVEEELDLTATLLAPLEMRDAIYGYEEPAEAEPAVESLPELAPAPAAELPPVVEPVVEAPVVEEIIAVEPAVEVTDAFVESDEAFAEPPEAPEELAALAALDGVDEADVVAAEGEPDLTETDLEPLMALSATEAEDLPTLEVEEVVAAEPVAEQVAAPVSLDVPLEERTDAEGQVLKAFEATDLGFDGNALALDADPIAEPETEPEPDVVMVGDTAVSRPLYDLYVAEARQHVGTLRDELPRFVANPMLVPQEPVIRAAHTLGGISGTARVTSVRLLAKALEHALAKLHLASIPPTTDQSELIRACGERLDGMVAEIVDGHMPLEVPELVGALENLQPYTPSAEPVLVEEAPVALFDEADVAAFSEAQGVEEESPVAFVAEDLVAEAPLDLPVAEATPGFDAAFEAEPQTAPYQESAPAIESLIAAQPAPAEEHSRAVLRDELDEQLMPIFYEEAEELSRDLSAAIRELREGADAQEAANAVARLLHTLKGSARMAGAMTLGEHVHGMENRLLAARDSGHAAAIADDLDAGLDQAGLMIGRMQAGLPAYDAAPQAPVEGQEGDAAPAAAASTSAAPVAAPVAVALSEGETQSGPTANLRVRAQLVDRFVNEAGEIAIARTRIEGELRTLRRSMLDLTENVIRLRNQLREVEIAAETQMQARVALAETQDAEFDPLEFDRFTRFQELTRMMAESVGDVTTIQQNLLKNLDAADTALHAQGRLSRDLQQALMGVRMVPFDEVADRLYRVVRQTAKELGKRANLDIRGGQIEIDRSVLDKMTAPIEHLLRNAIAHGLEVPEQRRAAGKDDIGQITLTVTQRSNEIAIELADDGRGLDFEAIRRRGESRGLLAAGEEAGETRLTQLIFEPGFSTAEQVSEVAGRGVGMDVVKSETIGVGGRIEVTSQAGRGARFMVHLPLTLAVTQALLVRAGERTYAIPSNMVEQVLELKQEPLDAMRAAGQAEWKERKYPVRYLPQLLGDAKSQPAAGRFHWVLLLRSGPDAIALHVDELRGNMEIVVKNAGPQFTRLQGFSGATVLADGEISLILNPVVLSQVVGALAVQAAAGVAVPQTVAPVAYVPTVMVTDDSLTVRKITSRLLEREGYRVITAKDGVDALEQLVDTLPDVMLLDIEMPRMDGFDLTRNIRADERLRGLPIIMITSRMADKHRNYAKEIGVNHYLGKPYNEEELLALIEEMTKR
ncbi:Hpt domain-containing protein [Niveibacterium sp. SC-1]|uniref:hybrid sensor histidine kinase/response regulator n=1 Tax=Niveibacterium sp. SC-1 TaxID=3135646 RepID=UPI00311E79B7